MTITSERIEGQPAFVLHTRPYRETSALVDFLTQDHGRITLMVKGVRQAKSKQRIATQSFSPLSISWAGKGDLKTLTQVEASEYWPLLEGRALCCGMYLNELLVRLVPNRDPVPHLFAVYQLALQSINDTDLEEAMLRLVEHRLLAELGIAPSFSVDMQAERLFPQQRYGLIAQQGFYQIDEDGNQQGPAYLGAHLLAIAEDDYGQAEVRATAKKVMRQLIQPLLGDKPLASRALFSTINVNSINTRNNR